MTRLSAVLALFLSTAAAAGPPTVAPMDQTAIRAFLTRTLSAYVANRDAQPWRRAVTPAMQKLLGVNERLNHGDESEALGADPICGCQDWKTIRITDITLAPRPDGKVTATVRLANFGPSMRTFVMARTPAGWRVDDVLERGKYGLRSALLHDNARLSRKPR
jgi:hypothetical protein